MSFFYRTSTIGLLICMHLACTPLTFSTYSVSANNISIIRNLNKKIKLGEFRGTAKTVSCRANPMAPPKGMTFAEYFKNAFSEELIIANNNSKDEILISINVAEIDVDCSAGTGFWLISADVSIDGSESVKITSKTTFEGSVFGQIVFNNAQSNFNLAAQDFLSAVLKHPKISMLKNSQYSPS